MPNPAVLLGPRKAPAGGGGDWSPAALDGLMGWYRAKDYPGSGPWIDQSPNGKDAALQLTPPTLTTTPSGGPALRFDGSQYFRTPVIGMGSAGEIWVVVKSETNIAAGSTGDRFAEILGFGNIMDASLYPWMTGQLYETFGLVSRQGPITPTMPIKDVWRIYRVVSDGSNFQMWLDGVTQHQASGKAVSWGTGELLIGKSWQSGVPDMSSTGDSVLAEVVLRDRVSTPGEVASMTQYLNNEHGLSVVV